MTDRLKSWKWWQWALAIFAGLVAVGAAVGGEENSNEATVKTVTVEAEEELRAVAPALQVRQPGDDGTVRRDRITLRGSVTPGAEVSVEQDEPDGRRWTANVNGDEWTARVKVRRGANRLVVIAEHPEYDEPAEESLEITRRLSAAERQAIAERRERERQEREARERERIAAQTKAFSGNGSQNIGSITVEEESILTWTNSGDPTFRQMLIYDKDFGISVSSDAPSGKTVVPPGTYRNITAAGDDWTITIRPR